MQSSFATGRIKEEGKGGIANKDGVCSMRRLIRSAAICPTRCYTALVYLSITITLSKLGRISSLPFLFHRPQTA